MNREGRLTAFARNPMASPMTSEIAHGKAYTSAITQSATSNIEIETTKALSYADGVSQPKGVYLSALENAFSEVLEFREHLRMLTSSVPKLGLMQ